MQIGAIIKRKVEERRIGITNLAKQLSCSRSNIYKMFERNSIDTNTLLRLCKILEFDFFELLSSTFKEKKGI